MRFESEMFDLPWLYDDSPCFAIQPINGTTKSTWLVLKGSGELVVVDFGDSSCTSVGRVDESAFDRTKNAALHVSDDGRFVAVANRESVDGAVVDLSTGQTTMILKREDYYVEHCPFPLAFVKVEGQCLLVHATQWNRLDVSDPSTGELLTARTSPIYETKKPRPEHYLNYFHATLLASPDGQWIANSGWAWAPVGVVRTWSVHRWLKDNVWESEDGPTAKDLCAQDDWDQPMCWINNRTLAAWGEDDAGDTSQLVLGLYDVESGERKSVLPVPKGRIHFDEGRLFVTTWPSGRATVWDVETGVLLLEDPNVPALKYHRGTKQFLGTGGGSGNRRSYVLSRFKSDP